MKLSKKVKEKLVEARKDLVETDGTIAYILNRYLDRELVSVYIGSQKVTIEIGKRISSSLDGYTISYNGINCPTPTLYLYSDNTYEYYYTFGTDNEKLIPKTGTFNYDITKIINNIDKYEENNFGPYSIKEENGKNYTTYNTNTELQELLTSLDITLEKRTYADCAFIAFIYVIKRAKAFVVCTKRKIDGLSLKKQQENQKKR